MDWDIVLAVGRSDFIILHNNCAYYDANIGTRRFLVLAKLIDIARNELEDDLCEICGGPLEKSTPSKHNNWVWDVKENQYIEWRVK